MGHGDGDHDRYYRNAVETSRRWGGIGCDGIGKFSFSKGNVSLIWKDAISHVSPYSVSRD